jgi:amidohydrolase
MGSDFRQSNALRDAMMTWRHDFHRHPELGFEELRTAERVATLLDEFGLEVHRGVGGTGVVGVLRRGAGAASIGLRADMDALAITEKNSFAHRSRHDGKMHACGHDGHTAMLLGAAKHLAQSDGFSGTVTFIFQPAEEHGRGALAMMDDGLFERFPCEAIYALHNMPSLPVGQMALRSGPIMACEDNFEIEVIGRGTHAAMPHLGRDPIVVASEIVLALQSVVARSLDPMDHGVVSVTDFQVDGTRNVIPERVLLKGDTRAFRSDVQDQIESAMQRLVTGIAAAHGVESAFRYSHEFAATENSPAEAARATRAARDLLGDDRVIADCPPIMASEDFGFMLQRKKGCYAFVGNGGDGPGGCRLHSQHYDFNDDILTVGADFWIRLVEQELCENS